MHAEGFFSKQILLASSARSQYLGKKVLCGTLTDGCHWIFLLVKLNDGDDGASYKESTVAQRL